MPGPAWGMRGIPRSPGQPERPWPLLDRPVPSGTGGWGLEVRSQFLLVLSSAKRLSFLHSLFPPPIARNISIGGVLVPLELKSKEPDGDRIVYTGTYDTEGVAPTKSGERQPIQITMPFTDIGTFETVWQVKFYNYHKRDHCQWGSPFSVIEYECKPNETRSLMWVNKESFL
ncbi:cannabinoid receptor interacting protein 1 [Rhinolophus ferrumequinum]|uniref:CB1 cannabinoid receptor-interacting protein 1 n=1 Tax=Rhinolophus ferrumequinum TaxID=59479 RepID=A0A7J7V7J1_RHIFE|nr:cannabinoid receptor interacting protein 1 [Rhinolophus ferrumequinum]